MKKFAIVLLALLIAGSAFAAKEDNGVAIPSIGGIMEPSRDALISFTDFEGCGAVFSMVDPDPVTGSVNSAFGDFVMNEDGVDFNYANDLCVLVANVDLSVLMIQIGGFSDFGATYRFTWPIGNGTPAGPGGGDVDFGENIDITGYHLWLGNGYGSGGCNTWTGSINLYGDVVDNEETSFGAVKALFR